MNKVILPFDDDTLWNIIKDKQTNTVYTVDFVASYANLKDSLLYYISNLQLDCVFDFTDATYDQKAQLIEQYINLIKICTNKQLAITLASICLRCKDLAYLDQSILTEDETDRFINDHVDQIDKIIKFADSVVLYIIYQLPQLHHLVDIDKVPHVDDKSIPLNVVNMFDIVEFACYYSVLNNDNLAWYDHQFTNPIYDNKDLSSYVFVPNNLVVAYLFDVANKLKEE